MSIDNPGQTALMDGDANDPDYHIIHEEEPEKKRGWAAFWAWLAGLFLALFGRALVPLLVGGVIGGALFAWLYLGGSHNQVQVQNASVGTSTTSTHSVGANGQVDISGPETVRDIDLSDLMPNETRTFRIPIVNSGHDQERYRVSEINPTGSVLALNALQVQATISGSSGYQQSPVFTGIKDGEWLIGNMRQHALDGKVANDGKTATTPGHDTLTLTVTLPATAGDEYMGQSYGWALEVTGEQTRGNPFKQLPAPVVVGQ